MVLALPAGRLLDRAFHRWLAVGAVLTAVGGLARLIAPDYIWALVGQLLVAVAQPLVLNAVTKVASEYLPPRLRPHGIAVGSAAIFVGMLLALILGTLFGGAHLVALLDLQAAFAVIAAAALGVRVAPPPSGRAPSRPSRSNWWRCVRSGLIATSGCSADCCFSASARSSR